MADTKTTALTENTAPLGSDLEYMVDDPGSSPASNKIYKGSNNLLPDGYILNGKLSVTVSSNNITVAILTRAGGNPSATDPVSVWINGTYRRITAACSSTKNAGTNWFNSGGAELATKEIDYFVYLIWNTTPATDIMDIGFARIPNGRVYSDFSSTTTNEKYLAFGNASTPTATDDCAVIGRFAATLSASASYNWSVPTFTNSNLVQHPIFETRWLSFTPTYSCSGSMTYGTVTTDEALYRFSGNAFQAVVNTSAGTVGGTPSTTISSTIPFTVGFAAAVEPGWGWVYTNSTYNAGLIYTDGTKINARLYNSGNWTAGSSFFGASCLSKY